MNKKLNEQWSQEYSKVKGVYVRLVSLIEKIQSEQSDREFSETNEHLAINIFNSNNQNDELSSSNLNDQFIHSQLLIECLIRMESSLTERQELIVFVKEHYQKNSLELKQIQEFELTYSENLAIWWYTKNSFVYRLLNKALRIQNIEILYLFRFLIRDLEEQLNKYKCSYSVRVYRGQQMSDEEINLLEESIGKYITMNSFLSTSTNKQIDEKNLKFENLSIDIQNVLFEIEANPKLQDIKPFADINQLSRYPKENEVLFMIGSIFRINQIRKDRKQIRHIQMILCSIKDQQLKILFNHMKKELDFKQITLLTFANILYGMGRLDNAEKYYYQYFEQLSNTHSNRSKCCEGLGLVKNAKGNYESNLEWFTKALEIDLQVLTINHPNIGIHRTNIAKVYFNKGDYNHALEFYQEALHIFENYYGYDDLHISDLGDSYNNLGNIHACLKNCDQALEYYKLSFNIKSKALPSNHPDIALTLENIGIIYETKKNFSQAQQIFSRLFIKTHASVIKINQAIECVSF